MLFAPCEGEEYLVPFSPLLPRGSRRAIYFELSIFFFYQLPLAFQERLNFFISFIVNTIVYGIWDFRNRATFHNGKKDHRAFIKFIFSDISMQDRLDQFRLTENRFNDVWSLPFFCAIGNGRINLNLQLCGISLSLSTLSVRGMLAVSAI